jgi:hypothetical protein
MWADLGVVDRKKVLFSRFSWMIIVHLFCLQLPDDAIAVIDEQYPLQAQFNRIKPPGFAFRKSEKYHKKSSINSDGPRRRLL